MSQEHMMQAMKEMFDACNEQYNAPGSCKKCLLYDDDAEPMCDENGNVTDNHHFCHARYPCAWKAFRPWLEEKPKFCYPKYAYNFWPGDEEFEAGGNTLRETIIKAVNDEFNEDYFLQVVSQGPNKMVLNGDLYVGVVEPLPEIKVQNVFQFIESMRFSIAEEIGLDHSPLFTTDLNAERKLRGMLTRTFWNWAKGLEDPGFAVRYIHKLEFHHTPIRLPE